MSRVLDELMSLIRSEARVVREFVTTPKGVFETVDEMIRVARISSYNIMKEIMRAFGLRKQ